MMKFLVLVCAIQATAMARPDVSHILGPEDGYAYPQPQQQFTAQAIPPIQSLESVPLPQNAQPAYAQQLLLNDDDGYDYPRPARPFSALAAETPAQVSRLPFPSVTPSGDQRPFQLQSTFGPTPAPLVFQDQSFFAPPQRPVFQQQSSFAPPPPTQRPVFQPQSTFTPPPPTQRPVFQPQSTFTPPPPTQRPVFQQQSSYAPTPAPQQPAYQQSSTFAPTPAPQQQFSYAPTPAPTQQPEPIRFSTERPLVSSQPFDVITFMTAATTKAPEFLPPQTSTLPPYIELPAEEMLPLPRIPIRRPENVNLPTTTLSPKPLGSFETESQDNFPLVDAAAINLLSAAILPQSEPAAVSASPPTAAYSPNTPRFPILPPSTTFRPAISAQLFTAPPTLQPQQAVTGYDYARPIIPFSEGPQTIAPSASTFAPTVTFTTQRPTTVNEYLPPSSTAAPAYQPTTFIPISTTTTYTPTQQTTSATTLRPVVIQTTSATTPRPVVIQTTRPPVSSDFYQPSTNEYLPPVTSTYRPDTTVFVSTQQPNTTPQPSYSQGSQFPPGDDSYQPPASINIGAVPPKPIITIPQQSYVPQQSTTSTTTPRPSYTQGNQFPPNDDAFLPPSPSTISPVSTIYVPQTTSATTLRPTVTIPPTTTTTTQRPSYSQGSAFPPNNDGYLPPAVTNINFSPPQPSPTSPQSTFVTAPPQQVTTTTTTTTTTTRRPSYDNGNVFPPNVDSYVPPAPEVIPTRLPSFPTLPSTAATTVVVTTRPPPVASSVVPSHTLDEDGYHYRVPSKAFTF